MHSEIDAVRIHVERAGTLILEHRSHIVIAGRIDVRIVTARIVELTALWKLSEARMDGKRSTDAMAKEGENSLSLPAGPSSQLHCFLQIQSHGITLMIRCFYV